MNTPIVLLGIVLLVAVVLVFLIIRRGEKRKHFSERKKLSLIEIYNQFFSTTEIPRDVFEQLWEELSNWMEISPGLLRPDDAFDKELAPEEGNEWDHPVGLIPDMIQTKFRKAGLPLPDINQVHTVRDYILLVAKTTRSA